MTLKEFASNQYIVGGFNIYDIELLIAATDLVSVVKDEFNVIIALNEQVIEQANYYRGKKVYGNIHAVSKVGIKSTWGNKYELYKNEKITYELPCVCGDYTKEEIIEIASALAIYCNTHNILENSYIKLITDFDMGIVCNAYEIALDIINFYKPFVDIKRGISIFNEKVKKNRDAISWLNYHKVNGDKNDILEELAQYGIQ